jgi:pimeloyl-ACP methyl ester carboxylesterase
MKFIIATLFILPVGIFMNVQAAEEIIIDCDGTGEEIFLIGGGPAFTTWNLEPIQQSLPDNHQVCRWDMRGVGENRSVPINPDLGLLDQWIADMKEVLPEEPVILWGHSWGALQVQLFANRYPERTRALILSNPVDPSLLSLRDIEQKRYVHPEIDALLSLEEIGTEKEKRHSFRSKIASYFFDAKTGWQYSEKFSDQDTNSEFNVRIWDEYRATPLTVSQLGSLNEKIAGIIHCRQDVLMPESQSEYALHVSKQKQYLLEDCGHFPWVEQPEQYFRILKQLVEKASI